MSSVASAKVFNVSAVLHCTFFQNRCYIVSCLVHVLCRGHSVGYSSLGHFLVLSSSCWITYVYHGGLGTLILDHILVIPVTVYNWSWTWFLKISWDAVWLASWLLPLIGGSIRHGNGPGPGRAAAGMAVASCASHTVVGSASSHGGEFTATQPWWRRCSASATTSRVSSWFTPLIFGSHVLGGTAAIVPWLHYAPAFEPMIPIWIMVMMIIWSPTFQVMLPR